MQAMEVLTKIKDTLDRETVFGDPIVRDDLTIIPVSQVKGGGGGGIGEASDTAAGHGEGVGFGVRSAPLGVFVAQNGTVRWRPVIDVNKVILGGQVVAVVALLTARSIVRMLHARRTGKPTS